MRHGCRSEKWIFEGEAREELDELTLIWRVQFPALPAAFERMFERLVRADWRLQWTEQRVVEMESTLEEIPAEGWTEAQHKQLVLFYRYHTSADRQFQRYWNVLKPYAQEPKKEQPVKETRPLKEAPAAQQQPVSKGSSLYQKLVVKIVDGETVTTMYPTNEQAMRVAEAETEDARATRSFEFPDGVPEEYCWLFPEEGRRRAGARRNVEMSVGLWMELAAQEKRHAVPCPLEPTLENERKL